MRAPVKGDIIYRKVIYKNVEIYEKINISGIRDP